MIVIGTTIIVTTIANKRICDIFFMLLYFVLISLIKFLTTKHISSS